MLLSDSFLCLLPVLFCILLWICVRFRQSFIVWWGTASLMLGAIGSFIPWRTRTGFHHGTGVPIPLVIWERDDTRHEYLDFPNPLGVVENPVFIFLLGICAWGVSCAFRALSRRIRHAKKVA
jgi:uncharacterized membrane protein